MARERRSARFRPSTATRWLVPLVLAVLAFGLLATLVLTLLAALGWLG